MRYVIALLTAIMISPVFSDTIGNIQYDLPAARQDWKKVQSLEEAEDDSEDGTTILYGPKEDSLDDPIEFFAAHVNNFPSAGTSINDIKDGLEEAFEGEINVVILESDADSTLYEWSGVDEGNNIYSIVRGFFSQTGTTLLMYQTRDQGKVESEKAIWIETLKSAKKI